MTETKKKDHMEYKEFLKTIKTYIEEMEEEMDLEWGHGRAYPELVSCGMMPDIYDEVLRRIEKPQGLPVDVGLYESVTNMLESMGRVQEDNICQVLLDDVQKVRKALANSTPAEGLECKNCKHEHTSEDAGGTDVED